MRRAMARLGVPHMAAMVPDRMHPLTGEPMDQPNPASRPQTVIQHAVAVPDDETPMILMTIAVCHQKGAPPGTVGATYLAGPIDRPHLIAKGLEGAMSVLWSLLQQAHIQAEAEKKSLITPDQIPGPILSRFGRA